MDFYQHLPFYINPVIFSIGSFAIRWYSVMYLAAFSAFYLLIKWRIKKGEYKNFKFSISNGQILNLLAFDFMLYAIVGMLIGARLSYVFFYNFSYYLQNPFQIIFPQNISAGISGMSYFGGLIGIVIAAIIYVKAKRLNFWQFSDFIVPAIPAAYFFGRLGNFLNGELFGRVTTSWIGMYFPNSVDAQNFMSIQLRYPSQLFEAFFEGIILFIILWLLRNKSKFPGYLLIVYLFGYGFFRFFIEFFRQPDPQIGLFLGFLTLGQIFSLILMCSAAMLYRMKQGKTENILEK